MLKNKKGFSLVELIVVIAIMAVLVGVLAPSLMKYVESSRKQKDESAASELANEIQIALSDENIYDEIVGKMGTADSIDITFAANNKALPITTTTSTDYPKLSAELKATIGESIKLSSKAHATGSFKVTITIKSGEATSVKGEWIASGT